MSEYVWQNKESRRTEYLRKRDQRKTQPQDVDAEADSGFEKRVPVPEGCAGMVIGKGGEHLKSVEKALKVSVQLEGDGKAAARFVTIRGSCPMDVEAAARELDFCSETMELAPHLAGWLCGRGGRYIKLIRELSGVAALNLNRDSSNGAQTHTTATSGNAGVDSAVDESSRCWLELKGKRESVEDARLCIDAHLSYHPVFAEMGENERELDAQLVEAQAAFGRRPASPRRAPGQGQRGPPRGTSASRAAGGRQVADGAQRGAPEKGGSRRQRGRSAGRRSKEGQSG